LSLAVKGLANPHLLFVDFSKIGANKNNLMIYFMFRLAWLKRVFLC